MVGTCKLMCPDVVKRDSGKSPRDTCIDGYFCKFDPCPVNLAVKTCLWRKKAGSVNSTPDTKASGSASHPSPTRNPVVPTIASTVYSSVASVASRNLLLKGAPILSTTGSTAFVGSTSMKSSFGVWQSSEGSKKRKQQLKH